MQFKNAQLKTKWKLPNGNILEVIEHLGDGNVKLKVVYPESEAKELTVDGNFDYQVTKVQTTGWGSEPGSIAHSVIGALRKGGTKEELYKLIKADWQGKPLTHKYLRSTVAMYLSRLRRYGLLRETMLATGKVFYKQMGEGSFSQIFGKGIKKDHGNSIR